MVMGYGEMSGRYMDYLIYAEIESETLAAIEPELMTRALREAGRRAAATDVLNGAAGECAPAAPASTFLSEGSGAWLRGILFRFARRPGRLAG